MDGGSNIEAFRLGLPKIEGFRLGAGTGFATLAAGFALSFATAAAISPKAVFAPTGPFRGGGDSRTWTSSPSSAATAASGAAAGCAAGGSGAGAASGSGSACLDSISCAGGRTRGSGFCAASGGVRTQRPGQLERFRGALIASQ